MVELNHERCVIEMTATEEMTNGAGVCQGGVVFILAGHGDGDVSK